MLCVIVYQQINNLDQMYKFLYRQKLPKLIQEEIKNQNRPTTSKDYIKLKTPQKKTLIHRWIHW